MLDKLTLFLPPQDPNPQVTLWRWGVYIGLSAVIIVVTGFFFGWFMPETSAAAQQLSGKLDRVEQRVKASDKERLEQQIFEQRIAQCMATGAIRTVYANRVTQLVSKWRELTGQPGNPPTYVDCNDLG